MTDDDVMDVAVAAFGTAAKKKLSSLAASGQPEDQLRNPLESLMRSLAPLCGIRESDLTLVGETAMTDLKTRPDFAVTRSDVLIGHIELKAPGKGADPRRFKDPHDKSQWERLRTLPNLVYTDGNAFSLWRDGERGGEIVELDGDIESSGAELRAPGGLLTLVESFFTWKPVPPSSPRELAEVSARLCRLLRDEVTEQLEHDSPALTALATDWRTLLFPEASDEQFADGYAQTVTFGLLLARARGVDLNTGLPQIAQRLGQSHSLIGAALRALTDNALEDRAIVTSVATLRRVLGVVDWPSISKGDPDAWLYFYEDFLGEYDARLRRDTGSYYTPPEVVLSMARMTHEALRTRLDLPGGFADPKVTVLDPAVGTGTFLLGVIRIIADHVTHDLGAGAVPAFLDEAISRIIGFEIQVGPFAVAQLRVLAELAELGFDAPAAGALHMFVTNTLANPYVEEEHLGSFYEPIAASRRAANQVKKDEVIWAVIGNPPYKERSHGEGRWVEQGHPGAGSGPPLLADFIPPPDWGVSAHVKHLYNPYVYFWRWATWKVFDQSPEADRGVVSFITVAGFLAGPGFQRMRAYLRERADAIWVIDCSPEGHQPPVSTRIFQGVQQPVCIVIAVRDGSTPDDVPAPVGFRRLGRGPRTEKFAELAQLSLEADMAWEACLTDWRAPFLPAGSATWTSYPSLNDLLAWSGSGVMPGRTWVVAADPATLEKRFDALVSAPRHQQAELFQEHARDRTVTKVLTDGLPGIAAPPGSIADAPGVCEPPVRIGYRSFDRQWIIPDKRLINQPNPTLWRIRSDRQVYLTALTRTSPSAGPAITLSGLVPDLDHYHGRGGRVIPLWLDAQGSADNVAPGLLDALAHGYARPVTPEDLLAYVAAVAAHPAYTATFAADLAVPGLRIPLTANPGTFGEAVKIGRRVIWLHTYGERFVDSGDGRPPGAPRVDGDAPKMLDTHGIQGMPDELDYDPQTRELHIGSGVVAPVSQAARDYEVSGVNVLDKWFGYRRRTRDRPVIGSRRTSRLSAIQPETWPASYTKDLIDLLNVLELLIETEPRQADLLTAVTDGPLIGVEDLEAAGVLPVPDEARRPPKAPKPAPPTQSGLDLS